MLRDVVATFQAVLLGLPHEYRIAEELILSDEAEQIMWRSRPDLQCCMWQHFQQHRQHVYAPIAEQSP